MSENLKLIFATLCVLAVIGLVAEGYRWLVYESPARSTTTHNHTN